MGFPSLRVFVDGSERSCVDVGAALGGRSWLLGVVALQAHVDDAGRAMARVRTHLTGWAAPVVEPLADAAVVQVALCADGDAPALPTIAAPDLDGDAARATLWLAGEQVATARLSDADRSRQPPPRAFGHVYCRYLRDGAVEPGCDLTDFLSLVEGTKYERLASRPIVVGDVVSFGWRRR